MKPGDTIYIWHDSAIMGMKQWLGKVIRINRTTITCLMEYRDKPARIPKHLVYLASEELAREYEKGNDQ